jgi:hypothetical protein
VLLNPLHTLLKSTVSHTPAPPPRPPGPAQEQACAAGLCGHDPACPCDSSSSSSSKHPQMYHATVIRVYTLTCRLSSHCCCATKAVTAWLGAYYECREHLHPLLLHVWAAGVIAVVVAAAAATACCLLCALWACLFSFVVVAASHLSFQPQLHRPPSASRARVLRLPPTRGQAPKLRLWSSSRSSRQGTQQARHAADTQAHTARHVHASPHTSLPNTPSSQHARCCCGHLLPAFVQDFTLHALSCCCSTCPKLVQANSMSGFCSRMQQQLATLRTLTP